MLKDVFVNYNGKLIEREELNLPANNRSFRYGDGFFETIRVVGENPLFIEYHFNRMMISMNLLKIDIPDFFNLSFFTDQIQRLIIKNDFDVASKVRFTIFRSGAGLYLPEINTPEFLIEAESLEEPQFILNKKGLMVDVFPDLKKALNSLSSLKSANALTFIMASLYYKENNFDDCFILNEENNLAEATSSNVFVIQNGILKTPPTSQGCVNGVMRKAIIENIAPSLSLNVKEEALNHDDLFKADEVFLTNAVTGIKWVISYKTRRYFNNTSVKLVDHLNKTFIS